MLPPIGASSAVPAAPVRAAQSRSRVTASIVTSRKPADTSSIPFAPTSVTNSAVSEGPASAPAVPPAAMKPYRRFACAVSKRSAIRLQNTLTANRLNTDTQTKKARAMSPSWVPPASKIVQKPIRLATKKA